MQRGSSVASECAEDGNSTTENNGNGGLKLSGMRMHQIDLSPTFRRWISLQITFWSLFQPQSDTQQTPSYGQKCLDWLITAASVHPKMFLLKSNCVCCIRASPYTNTQLLTLTFERSIFQNSTCPYWKKKRNRKEGWLSVTGGHAGVITAPSL